MSSWLQLLVTVVCSVVASSGFWAYFQSRHEKNDASKMMLKGLGHDRICHLGEQYITRGYITKDEYENLVDYLYKPYKALGGNGTAEKIINDVKKLEIRNS